MYKIAEFNLLAFSDVIHLTKCGPKEFLLTECGLYNESVAHTHFVGIIIIT